MDKLKIANREFSSRLFIGTGKFGSHEVMVRAVEASKAEVVTVAVRRFDPGNPQADILSFLDQEKVLIMANTSGCRDASDALRIAKIARAAGLPDWIKLELTTDPRYLLPDPIETLKAAEQLVKEKFTVLPYINADPVLAKRLEEAGCSTVMPLAAPIGSNQGLRTEDMLRIIIEQANVPVVVDAGLGAPSHAAFAMELGADAVLVNTAIAVAGDPVQMADAFKKAVESGRQAFESGLGACSSSANSSSPLTGFLDQ